MLWIQKARAIKVNGADPFKNTWNVLRGYQIFKNNLDKKPKDKTYMIHTEIVSLLINIDFII